MDTVGRDGVGGTNRNGAAEGRDKPAAAKRVREQRTLLRPHLGEDGAFKIHVGGAVAIWEV